MSSEAPIPKEQNPEDGFLPVDSLDFGEVRRGSEFRVMISGSVKPDAARFPVHIKVLGITKQGLRVEVQWRNEPPFTAMMAGGFRGIPDDWIDRRLGKYPLPTGDTPNELGISDQMIVNKLQFKTLKDKETGRYLGPSMTSGPIKEIFFKK